MPKKAKTITPTLGPLKGKTIGWSFKDPERAEKNRRKYRVKNPDKAK